MLGDKYVYNIDTQWTNVTISVMDQIFLDLIGKSLKEIFKLSQMFL